ncbi:MAG TPA: hypothetical protein VHJ78_02870 [Actinomycetota bacterium]|nr:hypothetical protein [Actinomycetota bacterium]
MEIGDYLNLVRKRIRLFLLVPVLAALVVVAAVLIRSDDRYLTTATVSTSSLSSIAGSQFSGGQGNRVLLETFSAASETPTVLARVSQRTGVPIGTLQSEEAISVGPIGESSLLRVTARVPQSKQSSDVAKAVSAETIKFILEPQIQLAVKSAEQAQRTIDDTQAKLSELGRTTGLALGIPDYEMKSRAVSALREELLRARAAGQFTLAASVQASLDAQSAELTALAPRMAEFQTLTELNRQALARVNTARSTEEQARALQSSADAGELVTLGETSKVEVFPVLVRRGLGGLGAGIFLAAILVILLEFLGRTERAPRPVTRETTPLVEEPEPEPL